MKLTELLYGGLKAKSDEEFYFLGLNALLEGQIEQAKDYFTQCAKLNHDHAEAFFQLARVYEQTGQSERALKLLQDLTFRSQLEPEFFKRIVRKAIDINIQECHGEEALELFAKHFPKSKDHKLLQQKLKAYFLCKNWSEAVKLGNQLYKEGVIDSQELAAIETQGVLSQTQAKDQLKDLYRILRTEPACSQAWQQALKINREGKDFANLVNDWKNWFRNCPHDAMNYTHEMEDDFFMAGQYSEVLGVLQEAFHKFSAPPAQLVHAIVRGYSKIGNEMAVHEIFEKLIPLAQSHPEKHLQTLLQIYVEYEESNSSSKTVRDTLLGIFKQNLHLEVTRN
jgi:lipopolysaccharide biosynthesis regulator YciM